MSQSLTLVPQEHRVCDLHLREKDKENGTERIKAGQENRVQVNRTAQGHKMMLVLQKCQLWAHFSPCMLKC